MAKELSLEEKIQRLYDIHEIQNLISRYQYLHTASYHKETAELFALKTPGVRAEVGNWGIYEGAEGIKRIFVGVHSAADENRKGIMNIHTLTTPLIEVAGDGKTAKGVWISPGVETMRADGKPKASWAWCKYGIDFIKEDGQWKFWHFHVYGILHTPYEKSWVDSSTEAFIDIPSQFPDELKADKPHSSDFWLYSPDAETILDPAPPEPYETFDEKTAY